MKKFFSIIACVAMLCAPVFVATSCGSDDDSSPRKEGMFDAYYPTVFTNLSKTSHEAGGNAMKAVQAALSKVEFTTNQAAEELLMKTVETELAKLPNDIKFELKERSVTMYFAIHNTNPKVEYTYDCRYLETTIPQLKVTVKSVAINSTYIESISESTRNLLTEAAKTMNEGMKDKEINSTYDKYIAELAAMAAKCLSADQLASIKACPEATSSEGYIPLINIAYTSTYVGHSNNQQIYPMTISALLK